MIPRIGISILSHNPTGSPALVRDLRKDLCDSIRAAGGQAIIVLPHEASYTPQALLDSIDALIVAGLDAHSPAPTHTGQTEAGLNDDSFLEIRLANLAIQSRLPLLALSSGMHLVNALFGGTSHEDLASDCDVIYEHWSGASPHKLIHSIVIEPESKLFEILDTDNISINSLHKKAIKRPGSGLIVSARSADGIIEGLELPGDEQYLVCVQGSPESVWQRTETRWLRLFKSLVLAGADCADSNFMDFIANSR